MGRDTAAGDPAKLEARSGLSHDAVREQLDRILAYREFHATDKMRDFLRFVGEDELIAGNAAVHVIHRSGKEQEGMSRHEISPMRGCVPRSSLGHC